MISDLIRSFTITSAKAFGTKSASPPLFTKQNLLGSRFFQTQTNKTDSQSCLQIFKAGITGIATLIALRAISNIPSDIESEVKEPDQIKNATISPTCCSDYRWLLLRATHFGGSLPQADGGKTTVYLPKEAPEIILKKSGETNSLKRFHQMEDVRSILHSQQSSHLIIPKATICGEFLIEERLPVNVDRFHNMGIYITEPNLFDDAILEMTRLFSKVYFGDLVSDQYHPSNNIVGDTVRYDNLPLYIEEENGKKIGKIGLIDLEYIGNKSNTALELETLVRIFPYHKDMIIKEATQLGMSIDKSKLEQIAAKGRKYLLEGYITHRDWLLKKGLTSKTTTETFEINSNRTNTIINVIEKELLLLNKGQVSSNKQLIYKYLLGLSPICGFLKNPEKEAKELALIIAPLLLTNLKNKIKENQDEILEKKKDKLKSESEFISLRAPIFQRHKVYNDVVKLLKKSYENIPDYANIIADQLFCVVLEELVKGQELFSFDPGFNNGGHQVCWIRY